MDADNTGKCQATEAPVSHGRAGGASDGLDGASKGKDFSIARFAEVFKKKQRERRQVAEHQARQSEGKAGGDTGQASSSGSARQEIARQSVAEPGERAPTTRTLSDGGQVSGVTDGRLSSSADRRGLVQLNVRVPLAMKSKLLSERARRRGVGHPASDVGDIVLDALRAELGHEDM